MYDPAAHTEPMQVSALNYEITQTMPRPARTKRRRLRTIVITVLCTVLVMFVGLAVLGTVYPTPSAAKSAVTKIAER